MSIKGFFFAWIKLLAFISGLFILGFLSALITMNLAMQEEEVKVPALVGKDILVALEGLNSIGLNLKIEGQEFHQYLPADSIISQQPEAGNVVKTGRTIKIVLSKGTKRFDVPDVMGQSWLRGQAILEENGFRAGSLIRVHHRDFKANQVISQDPPPGYKMEKGGAVNLLISEGHETVYYTMPEISGKDLTEAEQTLKALRLKVSHIQYEFNEEVLPDTVTDQSPLAGYPVSPRDQITLKVSQEKSIEQEVGTYRVLQYQVPGGGNKKKVKIIIKDEKEEKEILHEEKEPGSQIELLVKTTPHSVALIYVDEELVKEERFE